MLYIIHVVSLELRCTMTPWHGEAVGVVMVRTDSPLEVYMMMQ
jgi:hypothetical protein